VLEFFPAARLSGFISTISTLASLGIRFMYSRHAFSTHSGILWPTLMMRIFMDGDYK
jgi:hypothetical protein